MFPKVFLLACLLLPAVCAQNQPNQGAQPQQPAATVNVVMPPSPNVVVVGGGLYGTGVYPLPYLPLAWSQNTAYLQAWTAGISFLTPSFYGGPGYSYATPLYYSNPASPYYNATPVNPGAETTVTESGRAIVDFGPSYYAGESYYVGESRAKVAVAPAPSLAELAAQNRKAVQHSVRTYTNADAQRLGGNQVVPGIIPESVPPVPPQTPPPAAKPTPH
jgi:hypothetical protein